MRDGSVITMKGGGGEGGLQNFQLNGRQINPFPKLNGRLVLPLARSVPSHPFRPSHSMALFMFERERERERRREGDNNDDAGDDDRDAAAVAGKRMEERSDDADVSVQGRTQVGDARRGTRGRAMEKSLGT